MQWRAIPSLDGRYEASDSGEIRNATTRRVRTRRVDRFGYVRLVIQQDGRSRFLAAHRLVMEAFVGPCPAGREVNHINGNKTDNRLSNLEYVTRSENTTHAHTLGLKKCNYPTRIGSEHGRAKLADDDVREIRRLHGIERNVSMAKRFNVSVGTIEAIVYRKNWQHLE